GRASPRPVFRRRARAERPVAVATRRYANRGWADRKASDAAGAEPRATLTADRCALVVRAFVALVEDLLIRQRDQGFDVADVLIDRYDGRRAGRRRALSLGGARYGYFGFLLHRLRAAAQDVQVELDVLELGAVFARRTDGLFEDRLALLELLLEQLAR